MSKLNKATVALDGLQARICKVIHDWNPGSLQNEREYEASLAGYLRECAPDAHIQRQYRHLGETVDIWVKWDGVLVCSQVFIELKFNLNRKTECDRLQSQVDNLQPAEHNVIIVLCGVTSPALLSRLKEKFKKFSPSILPGSSTVVICKPSQC